MTPLRNNLEQAKREYGSAGYPGNLTLDVLGPPVQARRGSFAPLAIAAALAVGLTVGIFAGRSMRSPGGADVAAKVTAPTTAPTQSPTVVATGTDPIVKDPTATAAADASMQDAFTVVPTASSFTDQQVSVVPDLASLTSDASSSVAMASATTFAPMSLMLLSADEYGEAQSGAAPVESGSSLQSSSTSEERS